MMMMLAVVVDGAYQPVATADGTFDLETNSITNHVLFLELLVYVSTAPSRTLRWRLISWQTYIEHEVD